MEGAKLQQAREGAVRYSEGAIEQGHAVGLITFANDAALVLTAIDDFDSIRDAVWKISAGGTTNLSAALTSAIDCLTSAADPRSIVVVTDGRPDDPKTAIQEATRAKAAGITIITIGTDDADTALLRQLSSEPGMSVHTAADRLSDAMASAVLSLPAGAEGA